MAKNSLHLTPDGPKKCSATVKDCKYGGGSHYSSPNEAEAAYAREMASEMFPIFQKSASKSPKLPTRARFDILPPTLSMSLESPISKKILHEKLNSSKEEMEKFVKEIEGLQTYKLPPNPHLDTSRYQELWSRRSSGVKELTMVEEREYQRILERAVEHHSKAIEKQKAGLQQQMSSLSEDAQEYLSVFFNESRISDLDYDYFTKLKKAQSIAKRSQRMLQKRI